MSDQETRDRRNRKRAFANKKHRRHRRAGPPPAKRRRDPWCDEYVGETVTPDPEYNELKFEE